MLQFNYDIRVMNFFRNNLQNKYINFAFFTQQYINKIYRSQMSNNILLKSKNAI